MELKQGRNEFMSKTQSSGIVRYSRMTPGLLLLSFRLVKRADVLLFLLSQSWSLPNFPLREELDSVTVMATDTLPRPTSGQVHLRRDTMRAVHCGAIVDTENPSHTAPSNNCLSYHSKPLLTFQTLEKFKG